MKLYSVVVLLLALTAGCAAPGGVRSIDVLREAPLYTFNEHELDAYLGWLSRQEMSEQERAVHLARKNVGQPYRLFLLGEYPFELYDPDPLYCLSASDCVTFVEHTYAMTLSDDWRSFFRVLQRLRYRDGVVGILTRNHFTEADWNLNNAWLFQDVTTMLRGAKPAAMRVRIDRLRFFAQYGLIPDEPVQIFVDTYIPRENVSAVASGLRDGDIVEVVRGNETWQYVGHMGLIARDDAGRPNLIHSTKPAVREEPLLDYITRNPAVLGFKFLRRIDTTEQSIATLSEGARGISLQRF